MRERAAAGPLYECTTSQGNFEHTNVERCHGDGDDGSHQLVRTKSLSVTFGTCNLNVIFDGLCMGMIDMTVGSSA